ncbi:MAG: hypothetical protein RLZZ03_687 [Pseudomonadota bacterium]|jgi:urease beta subunit
MMAMVPGEYFIEDGEHALNPGRRTTTLVVQNTADRPIQVGSHYHFAETNAALGFDRASNAPWSWWTTPASARFTVFADSPKEHFDGRHRTTRLR